MLSVARIATSAVYGAADIGTEYADTQLKLTKPFQNVTDIQRTLVAVGGALGAHFIRDPKYSEVSETLSIAAIPLFEKTVVNGVLSFMGNTTRFAPRGQILVKRPGNAPGAAGNIPGVIY